MKKIVGILTSTLNTDTFEYVGQMNGSAASITKKQDNAMVFESEREACEKINLPQISICLIDGENVLVLRPAR